MHYNIVLRYGISLLSIMDFNMFSPTIQHRTVGLQPRDFGRLAPPTEPTESHDGRLGIANPKTIQYSPFPDNNDDDKKVNLCSILSQNL